MKALILICLIISLVQGHEWVETHTEYDGIIYQVPVRSDSPSKVSLGTHYGISVKSGIILYNYTMNLYRDNHLIHQIVNQTKIEVSDSKWTRHHYHMLFQRTDQYTDTTVLTFVVNEYETPMVIYAISGIFGGIFAILIDFWLLALVYACYKKRKQNPTSDNTDVEGSTDDKLDQDSTPERESLDDLLSDFDSQPLLNV